MKFSEQWLRDFVNPPLGTEDLARLLTMAGLEVEAIESVAPVFSQVIVGEVLDVQKHPNADRLSLCKVNIGTDTPLSIVCGAPNVVAGMKAPVALVGAELPGLTISAAKVRGIESSGMLCSARELGLSEDHGGVLALSEGAPVGADIRSYLQLDDRLLTLKLTPNRGDCLSLHGVAREVSIVSRSPLKLTGPARVNVSIKDQRKVFIVDSDACPRYCGRVIKGVDPRASTPDWMVRRLERSGLRPVSALVDVTNYVMLEMGQPLHAFDNAMLEGEIIVRRARSGESLKLLNGQVVPLDPDMLLIADERKPIALGGVMGGDESAVTDATTEIFLESAFFDPVAVAGRARRLKLNSDAAYRFERGVDFAISVDALERATGLILEICGGAAGPVTEAVGEIPVRKPIHLRTARVTRILGVPFSDDDIAGTLAQLQVKHARENGGFMVEPPSHRFDLAIEEDLVEEVARLYGYDNIPSRAPRAELSMLREPEQTRGVPRLKSLMVERDYFEVINFSFVDAEWESDFSGAVGQVALENPIAAQMNVMRSCLTGSLIANLRLNLSRKINRVRVFEVARVFEKTSTREPGGDIESAVPRYKQPRRVGGLSYGPVFPEQWGVDVRNADFYDVKADIEALASPRVLRFERTVHAALHPGRAAVVMIDNKNVGWIGELHPKWQQKYELPVTPILFELDCDALLGLEMPAYSEISRFPPVIRDLAVTVDEGVAAQSLVDAMWEARGASVQALSLFDVYRGKGVESGQKSLAFRVVIQDTSKTLTDEEADAAMATLTEVLKSGFGAKLRA